MEDNSIGDGSHTPDDIHTRRRRPKERINALSDRHRAKPAAAKLLPAK